MVKKGQKLTPVKVRKFVGSAASYKIRLGGWTDITSLEKKATYSHCECIVLHVVCDLSLDIFIQRVCGKFLAPIKKNH